MHSMSEDSIPTVVGPEADDPRLPIRMAAAIAFHNVDRTVLIARRNPDFVDEFKGAWSIPSAFIDQEHDAASHIADKLSAWFNIRASGLRLVGKRMALRKEWRLLMLLFVCDSDQQYSAVVSRTSKYDAVQWVDGKQFFCRFSKGHLGDCAKLYLDYLA